MSSTGMRPCSAAATAGDRAAALIHQLLCRIGASSRQGGCITWIGVCCRSAWRVKEFVDEFGYLGFLPSQQWGMPRGLPPSPAKRLRPSRARQEEIRLIYNYKY